MTMVNFFDTETYIEEKLTDLFTRENIIVEADSEELDNEYFNDRDTNEEKIGVLILNGGYRTDPLVGNSRARQQRIKMLWQVVVVCPKDLYKSHGGAKMLEVMQLLKGWRVSPEIGIMQLIDDERGFNRADFANDLAYLPMMFSVDAVI